MIRLATNAAWWTVLTLMVLANSFWIFIGVAQIAYPNFELFDQGLLMSWRIGMSGSLLAAVSGVVSALAWASEGRRGRAIALSLLSGLSLYTLHVCWYVSMHF